MGVSRPFGRYPQEVTAAARWYFGSGDRYEIEVRRTDGELIQLIRRPLPNRLVTDEIIEARERRLREAREARGETGAVSQSPFDDMTYPESMPAHDEFRLDAVGNLWVAYYRIEGEPFRWGVYDRAGHWLGDVDTPTGGWVTDIGEDYVLGIWRDELDVLKVRRYRLVKRVP
jgi:hypothetical protein